MRQLIFLTFIIILFSCNNSRKPTPEDATQKITKENIEIPIVFNNSKDSSVFQVVDYLLKKVIDKPDSYKPLSWGKVEIMNTPSFKFRVSHKFICIGFELDPFYTGQKEYDVIFHLDSLGKVVSMCQSSDYLKYYSKEGLLSLYSSFEFEQIAIDNKFDQLYQKTEVISSLVGKATFNIFTFPDGHFQIIVQENAKQCKWILLPWFLNEIKKILEIYLIYPIVSIGLMCGIAHNGPAV